MKIFDVTYLERIGNYINFKAKYQVTNE